MVVKEVLEKTTKFFKDKGIDSARLDAEILLGHGLGLERIQLYLKFDQPLKESELVHLRELVKRRSQGEPIAYILGEKDFCGSTFKVSSAVLIPRPETELLVEEVEKYFSDRQDQPLTFADLGTGSGCIGLSLLKHFPKAKLFAVDVSAEALTIAKENAELLGVIERVEFIHSDALTALTKIPELDAVAANPPYIAEDDPMVEKDVKLFEPHSALFAKDQGLALLKNWSQAYKAKLKSQGLMIMEMGYQQGPAMKDHFLGLGALEEVRVIKDYSGHDRFICGVKNG